MIRHLSLGDTRCYTALIKGGYSSETGKRMAPVQAPVKFFNMDLTRPGDSF